MKMCKCTLNKRKSNKEMIFQGLADFCLMSNENIHCKQFCPSNLHVLKVNWKILILYRKIKENSALILVIATKKKLLIISSSFFERLTSETDDIFILLKNVKIYLFKCSRPRQSSYLFIQLFSNWAQILLLFCHARPLHHCWVAWIISLITWSKTSLLL